MSLTTTAPTPDRRAVARSALLVLLLLGLVATAAVGLRTGLGLISHRSEHAAELALAAPTRTDLGLGQPVRTSFGAVTAVGAEINNGLSNADLGGMTHGVSGVVSAGRAQIEVIVTLANTGTKPVLIAADQFRLVTRNGSGAPGAPLKPSGTTLLAGPLPAGASVDTRVAFVVPTDGASMQLQYADPGLRAPVRIALGRTDRIAAPKGHEH